MVILIVAGDGSSTNAITFVQTRKRINDDGTLT